MNPHNIPSVGEFKHSTDLQIRFSDVDVLGHVNNTVYLAFYDTGKAWFFSDIHERVVEWSKVETVIANIDCCFVAPIYFGEKVAVYSRCEAIYDRSFKVLQVIAEKESGAIKSACETVMVCFDPERKESMPMPEHWRRALEKSMAETPHCPDLKDIEE